MKEQLISFKTAKLAKDKGFDWRVRYYYSRNATPKIPTLYEIGQNLNINTGHYPAYRGSTSAPTQSLLQKWLREVHSEFVIADIYNGRFVSKVNGMWQIKQANPADTYEQALEKGLYEGLKLIKIN